MLTQLRPKCKPTSEKWVHKPCKKGALNLRKPEIAAEIAHHMEGRTEA